MTDFDKLAREAISRDTDKNIFVEAGAGSGKTTQLVERMTALVASGVDISTICALTFTKAAAREFYGRFQVRLAELEAESKDETVRANCRRALDNIDLCFMGTIDSFSELILREYPIAAGIPSDFTTTSEDSLDRLYTEAWNKIISRKCSNDIFNRYLRFIAVCEKSRHYFLTVSSELAQRKDSDIRIPDFKRDIDLYFSDLKNQIVELFECLIANPDKTYAGKGNSADKYVGQLQSIKAVLPKIKGSWSECLKEIEGVVKTANGYRITCLPEEIGLRPGFFKELKSPKNVCSLEVSRLGIHEAIREYIYCLTLDLVVPALKMITEDSRRSGDLGFLDAKMLLRDMLKKDAANGGRMIRHIRGRHSRFLADEFQDTDPVQTEILFYLTAETPDPDVSSCVPVPGSLFIVGDPKQSIYRFRGADISAFLRTRERFEAHGGEVLSLTRNFRSTNTLKAEFNRLFRELLPSDTKYQSRFEDIPVEGEDDPSVMTGFYKYRTAADVDTKTVAGIIRTLIADPACIVRDPRTKELRRLMYKDIMVITPKKDIITDYLSEFAAAGIPCYAEGGSQLEKCPSFLEVNRIFKALAEPDNNAALAAVLTGGCFGLTEDEFSAVLPEISLISFKPTGHERTDKAFEKLTKLFKASRYILPSVLFGKAVEELELLSHISSDALECLYFARELLRSAEADGTVCSIAQAAGFLNGLITDNKQERSLRFELAENSVKIANLHKVKGLEANVVILAAPSLKDFAPSIATVRDDGRAETFVFNCKGLAATNKYFRDEYNEESLAGTAEKERLLYVAATRARSILLVADPGEELNYWSFLSERAEQEFSFTVPDFDNADKGTEDAAAVCAGAADPFKGAASKDRSYELILPSKIKHETAVTQKQNTDNGSDVTDEPETEKKRNAALIGTLVHRLMERLVTVKFKAQKEQTVNAVFADIGADESYSEMLSGVFDTVMSGGFKQENDFPADIKSELAGAETCCEVPFCYMRGSELCNGVIDLLYRKNGKTVIVDYKTTAETENLDENYAAQLAEYKAAVKQITGEEAEAFIYHIDV